MARPREFDEKDVLDAAIQCFWSRGYDATSVKDLVGRAGIAAASLYNAYGGKRALFRSAFDRYVEESVGSRIGHCARLPPRAAIGAFFEDIVARSLSDPEAKGCLIVNSALELAPHDREFQEIIADVLGRIEAFFRRSVEAGQADGTISRAMPAEDFARHLLGVLMGVRVLARVRPERALLQGVVAPALALLDPTGGVAEAAR